MMNGRPLDLAWPTDIMAFERDLPPSQGHVKLREVEGRSIRCKTGHLTGVSSVCGYLQTPDGKLRVFAIILNGADAKEDDLWEMVSRWAN